MKHGKREMPREHRNHKGLMALVALALILCCAVGGTVAWLTTSTGPVTNTFTPTKVETTIDEEFEDGVKKNVKVKNEGDIPVYMRAAIIINWADAAGNIYPQTPVLGTNYSMSYGSDWKKEDDGFYYYTKVVNPKGEVGDETTALIVKCEPLGDVPAAGYDLQVTILAEAIQSVPAKAVKDAWGVDPTTLLS